MREKPTMIDIGPMIRQKLKEQGRTPNVIGWSAFSVEKNDVDEPPAF